MRRLTVLLTLLVSILAAAFWAPGARAADRIYFTTPVLGGPTSSTSPTWTAAAPPRCWCETRRRPRSTRPWGVGIDAVAGSHLLGQLLRRQDLLREPRRQLRAVTSPSPARRPERAERRRRRPGRREDLLGQLQRRNKISWAKLDGSGGGDLNTGTATVCTPIGVAIDTAAKKIYWANYGGDKVSFARLDNGGGGDLNIIGTTVNQPWGVTVDSVAERVFWGNFATNALDFARPRRDRRRDPHHDRRGPAGSDAGRDRPRHRQDLLVELEHAPRDHVRHVNGSGGGGTLYPSPGERPDRHADRAQVAEGHRRAGDHGARVHHADDALVLEGQLGDGPARGAPVPRPADLQLPVDVQRLDPRRRHGGHAVRERDRRLPLHRDRDELRRLDLADERGVHRDAAAPAAAAHRRRRRPRRRRSCRRRRASTRSGSRSTRSS